MASEHRTQPTETIFCAPLDFAYAQVQVLSLGYSATSLVAFILACVVAAHYNHVEVLNNKIRTGHISNTQWLAYFLMQGFRFLCHSLAMTFSSEFLRAQYGDPLRVAAKMLHGFATFAATIALDHQRTYRSAAAPPNAPMRQYKIFCLSFSVPDRISHWEIGYYLLLGGYLLLLVLDVALQGDTTVHTLFILAFLLQRLPIVALVALITLSCNTEDRDVMFGPKVSAKAYLLAGATLACVFDMPLSLWESLLSGDCFFTYISWLDLINIGFIGSLLLFFLFLRKEFLRNVEECIWTTVSQIQDDTLHFRHFG